MKKQLTLLTFLFLLAIPVTFANIDSLIQITENTTDDSVLLVTYNNIGSASYRTNQKLAEQYWNRAFDLATQKLKEQSDSFYKRELSTANNGLGIINRRLGNLPTALAHYQTSLKLNEELGDTVNISYSFYNIGVIYRDLKEYDMALDYYNKSLAIREKAKDTLGMAGSYNGIGVLYRRMEEYDKAIDYYKKSLACSEIANDDVNVAQSYNNIGVVKVMQGNLQEAFEYFDKAFEMHKEKDNKGGMAKYYANVSYVYNKLGNFSKAIASAEKSYAMYAEVDNKGELSSITHRLSKIYENTGDYKQSLSFYKKYISYRDSVYNERTTKEITQKEMQFEFDKRMLSDRLARAEAEKIRELEHHQEIKEQRTYMYSGGLILVLLIVFSVILYNRLKQSNRQKVIIEKQKILVEEKNKEVLDSINYAKRIQSAILPPIDTIKKSIPNIFVFYRPKDIVAGDFYWYFKTNDRVLIAVADCTGHGVPGAMVSVICNNALNRAVNDFKLSEPAKILDKTAELVIQAFKKNEEGVKDGMDISLCAFNLKDNLVAYSGAINSLYHIRKDQLNEIKGDKQPIGQYAEIKPFTQHEIQLEKGDKVYLFTDGYPDQFGGEKGKKFMYKRFRELLLKVSSKNIDAQEQELEQELMGWKRDLEQVDDICVIGIEV